VCRREQRIGPSKGLRSRKAIAEDRDATNRQRSGVRVGERLTSPRPFAYRRDPCCHCLHCRKRPRQHPELSFPLSLGAMAFSLACNILARLARSLVGTGQKIFLPEWREFAVIYAPRKQLTRASEHRFQELSLNNGQWNLAKQPNRSFKRWTPSTYSFISPIV